MIRPIPNHHRGPQEEYSFGGIVAFLLVLFAIIAMLSNPILVASFIAGAVILAATVQKLLSTYVEKIQDRTRTLKIPGIGKVQYRVTPR